MCCENTRGAFWNRGDCRGAPGSVIDTIRDGAIGEIGNGFNLGAVTVVGIGSGPTHEDGVVALVGIDVTSIYCRVFMDCICSSPTANKDDGAGLLSFSDRSSTAWRVASVEGCFGTEQLCRKIFTFLTILSTRVAWT